ncbi:MAG: hypothetical protein Q7R35_02735 [Elusimicrobiota bacterium]|nr:hypothetical protein [Elusimicrobiota bacterium]
MTNILTAGSGLMELAAARIAGCGFKPTPGAAVYAGFGLAGKAGLSVGTPFDVMGMVVAAEAARRHILGSRLIFLVADTHALRTGDYSKEKVRQAALRSRTIVKRAAELIGVPEVVILLASELENEPDYRKAVEQAVGNHATGENEYFLREAADIAFLSRHAGVAVKVGWTLADNPAKAGRFDEQSFDAFTCRTFPEVEQHVTFLYTKAGRTLDRAKPKAAPYLAFDTGSRVIIHHGEDARGKVEACPDQSTREAVVAHLGTIVGTWEMLAGAVYGEQVLEKVTDLIPKLAIGMA